MTFRNLKIPVFMCGYCGGIYGYDPVSQCDCNAEDQYFIESFVEFDLPEDWVAENDRELDKS